MLTSYVRTYQSKKTNSTNSSTVEHSLDKTFGPGNYDECAVGTVRGSGRSDYVVENW